MRTELHPCRYAIRWLPRGLGFPEGLGVYVNKHAAAILERLRNGSMPCDGAWPQERVDVFERWIASGKPE